MGYFRRKKSCQVTIFLLFFTFKIFKIRVFICSIIFEKGTLFQIFSNIVWQKGYQLTNNFLWLSVDILKKFKECRYFNYLLSNFNFYFKHVFTNIFRPWLPFQIKVLMYIWKYIFLKLTLQLYLIKATSLPSPPSQDFRVPWICCGIIHFGKLFKGRVTDSKCEK